MTCTEKVLFLANLAATALLTLGAVFRFMHCFGGSEAPKEGENTGKGFNLFFFIVTLYMVTFIIMILVGLMASQGYCLERGFS